MAMLCQFPNENDWLKIIFSDIFREVAHSCLTAKELLPNYNEKISEYAESVYVLKEKFKMTISNKMHIIISDVPRFCDKFGISLGKLSEQETEASHYQFSKLWEARYKIKDFENPRFKAQLHKACLDFNQARAR